MKIETTETLKAQKSRFPFLLLYGMVVAATVGGIWIFVQKGDFSIYRFIPFIIGLSIFGALAHFAHANFKIGQSIEITNEGIWSLSWSRTGNFLVLPKLEMKLLKWADLQKWEMTGAVIRISGSHMNVNINTFLFANRNDVIDLINRFSKPK